MDPRDVLSTRVERAAVAALRATGAPGLAVAVVTPSGAAEVAVGHANLAEAAEMRTDTVFRAGSMSKLYTATAVMQLSERGRLCLADPVRSHLPHLSIENPFGPRDVSVEDLLSCRSGLAVDTTAASLSPPIALVRRLEDAYSQRVLREYHSALPLWTAPVGERYQYSNLGVATLGHLVEVASGEGTTFDQYVQEHVLEPLDMASSAFVGGATPVVPARLRDRMATGYMQLGRTLVRTPELWGADYPANGLVTTAGDHMQLLGMLARGGSHRGRRILAAQSVEAMRRPRMPLGDLRIAPDGSWWVGLCVMLANLGGRDLHLGHPGGYMWGWWSISRVYPERGLAFVILLNAWDMGRWHDPANPDPASLLADALPTVAEQGADVRDRSWGWKRAYAAGRLLAERTCGFLGVADDQAERKLSACNRAAGPDDWDEQGFGEGVRDFLSGELRVEPYEMAPLLVSLGAPRDLPMPLMFWPEDPATAQEHPAATVGGRPAGRHASGS